jgi:hypothetical protein
LFSNLLPVGETDNYLVIPKFGTLFTIDHSPLTISGCKNKLTGARSQLTLIKQNPPGALGGFYIYKSY